MTLSPNTFSAGLGLRRELVRPWREALDGPDQALLPDFVEITPENWMDMGGRFARDLRIFTERLPVLAHGLSLSIGSPDPIDWAFVDRLKSFLELHEVQIFSEHLSYCSADGHLYDLMPIPFTEAAVQRTARRITEIQDRLGRQLAVENVSYYAAPGQEMSELEFLHAVLERADCLLLLDVNNVWVNSVNHGYDPRAFIAQLPPERVAYQHIAGHLVEAPDLIIDTHGADVVDAVWDLFSFAFEPVVCVYPCF